MSDEELVRLWGRATVEHLEAIASGIFARWGVDFATARRAGGYTNACWLAGGLALRLAIRPDQDKIRRECQLAGLLPAEVGYPAIVETGVTGGHEWSLCQEIPCQNLGEAWPGLLWEERAAALRDLWHKTACVHRLDLAAVDGLVRGRAWFNSNDPAEAEDRLARLEREQILPARQAGRLREALDCHWQSLTSAARVVNHGDLTTENCLWQHGRVVSLMDFEWAVIGPAELDWNGLLKWALGPADESASRSSADRAGQQLLQQTAIALARPALTAPGSPARLLGSAILLEIHQLNNWLDHPDGEGPLPTWDPYRRLLSLADGSGGYLAPLLA